jgi:hypothetical protein
MTRLFCILILSTATAFGQTAPAANASAPEPLTTSEIIRLQMAQQRVKAAQARAAMFSAQTATAQTFATQQHDRICTAHNLDPKACYVSADAKTLTPTAPAPTTPAAAQSLNNTAKPAAAAPPAQKP